MPATKTPAGGIRLRHVLRDCQIVGARDVRISSCCSDPQQCRPGDLFVALDHGEIDGHDLAHEAVARGASAILAERPLPVSVPVCLVKDTRVAYGRVCQALVGKPAQQLCTIGVTGTHGKTVVSALVASVLRAAGKHVGVHNSLEFNDSLAAHPGPRSSSPPELALALAQMQSAGATHAVLELSSRDLAQRRCAGVRLNAAVLTNVRRANLDFHTTVENYRRSKLRIFKHLKPKGFAVLDADEPFSQTILPQLSCAAMTIALHGDAEISANIVQRHVGEQTFLLTAGSDMIPVRTRMIGDHHVRNCLLAAATGLALGLDLPTIVHGLEAVEFVPRRLQRIECGQPFGVFVDVADSPDRLAIALQSLKRVTRGRLICVYGASPERPQDERPLIGRVAERGASLGIITASQQLGDEPLAAIHDVLDGYERPARAHVMPDRQHAITWALSQARPGDCVLIAGCRDHMVTFHNGRAEPADDGQFVRDWLYSANAHSELACR
jgi:UDP-N-acetylmuramoyl-L-alanyl-D-glutamate--2,6-diaminopimelate ligase